MVKSDRAHNGGVGFFYDVDRGQVDSLTGEVLKDELR